MRITNHSNDTIWVIQEGYASGAFLPGITFKPVSKKVILKIEHLPCQVEIEDEPEGENEPL